MLRVLSRAARQSAFARVNLTRIRFYSSGASGIRFSGVVVGHFEDGSFTAYGEQLNADSKLVRFPILCARACARCCSRWCRANAFSLRTTKAKKVRARFSSTSLRCHALPLSVLARRVTPLRIATVSSFTAHLLRRETQRGEYSENVWNRRSCAEFAWC
jgi:hypothetical protein